MTKLPDDGPPVVVELDPAPDPEAVFRRLATRRRAVFFDSALRDPERGRHSYVAADPYDEVTAPADGEPVLPELARRLRDRRAAVVDGLPPWQGGAAGVIGYEIGRSLERLPRPRSDEFRLPALAMGVYDVVVAFDHERGRAWIVSQGLPAEGDARRRRADERAAWMLDLLSGDGALAADPPAAEPLGLDQLAPAFETHAGVLSDFSRDGYLDAVRRAVEHLRAGDAYQINLSQRLLLPDPGDPVELYCRLRRRNPAPMGGFFDGGAWQVASASPERFLRVDGGRVETRPIKGTRPRGATDADDARIGEQLVRSDKDRAENVMIVDLLRSDLSRVCADDSVAVPKLLTLEKYAHVQHLVSVVEGRLRDACGVADLLAATLPGGSITGAPKVRAQQLIAQLEPTARGPYCGAMAWIGLPDAGGRQAMDSSVLIRTLTRARGWVQAPVGGGVVVRSDPEREYAETWDKAAGLVDAVAG